MYSTWAYNTHVDRHSGATERERENEIRDVKNNRTGIFVTNEYFNWVLLSIMTLGYMSFLIQSFAIVKSA